MGGKVSALMHACRSRGIELFVRHGRLGAKPKSLINAELESEISAHKVELIEALSMVYSTKDNPLPADVNASATQATMVPLSARGTAGASERGSSGENSELPRKVLKELADHPETKYAYVVDNPDTDPVIVGFGIRDVATCEIAIPKERFDPFEFLLAIKDMAGTA